MPPPEKERQPLTAAEIDVLRRWIEQGANWGTHWAFEPPTAPPLPITSRPDWVRQGLDAFVLERLDAEGLALRPRPLPLNGCTSVF